jgi:hypothetical protein
VLLTLPWLLYGMRSKRIAIKNASLEFWNQRVAHLPALDVDETMKKQLREIFDVVHEKLQLPSNLNFVASTGSSSTPLNPVPRATKRLRTESQRAKDHDKTANRLFGNAKEDSLQSLSMSLTQYGEVEEFPQSAAPDDELQHSDYDGEYDPTQIIVASPMGKASEVMNMPTQIIIDTQHRQWQLDEQEGKRQKYDIEQLEQQQQQDQIGQQYQQYQQHQQEQLQQRPQQQLQQEHQQQKHQQHLQPTIVEEQTNIQHDVDDGELQPMEQEQEAPLSIASMSPPVDLIRNESVEWAAARDIADALVNNEALRLEVARMLTNEMRREFVGNLLDTMDHLEFDVFFKSVLASYISKKPK